MVLDTEQLHMDLLNLGYHHSYHILIALLQRTFQSFYQHMVQQHLALSYAHFYRRCR